MIKIENQGIIWKLHSLSFLFLFKLKNIISLNYHSIVVNELLSNYSKKNYFKFFYLTKILF